MCVTPHISEQANLAAKKAENRDSTVLFGLSRQKLARSAPANRSLRACFADRDALAADQVALAIQQFYREFPRVTRQNVVSAVPRLCWCVPPSGQPAPGRVPCRPTPAHLQRS